MMTANNYAFVLLRVDSDGYGFDTDYPVEAVFLSMESAIKYRDNLIREMIENGEIEGDQEPEELFEITKAHVEG